jgi:phage terminase small subunit
MTMTRELTPMKKAFADAFLETDSATEAVKRTWGGQLKKKNENNFAVTGHRLLRDAKVREYLQQNAYKAGARVVELIDSKREDIALRASQDVLDRVEGKAGQTLTLNNDQKTINIQSVTLLMGNLYQRGEQQNNALEAGVQSSGIDDKQR